MESYGAIESGVVDLLRILVFSLFAARILVAKVRRTLSFEIAPSVR